MAKLNMNFWITKKTVQRKLGSKEDEHIISSDADLDAKIEVFKSISETSADLSKIIDQYQERICILSQEECVFGRFLKEVGKRSKTTGHIITNTGKAISYSGQQRMCVRVPLLRLHHEVEVFRCRAIRDSAETLRNMEKDRTEYRAALSWMKYASSELDPEKGLDKFRTAQSHVRASKQHFDKASMDSIQKIDLLAAARCNMYSHALVAYMNELKQFAQKTANTYAAVSRSLLKKPKYDFCVLKDLTQEPEEEQPVANSKGETAEGGGDGGGDVDKDQTLFFADDYVDNDDLSKDSSSATPMEEPHKSKSAKAKKPPHATSTKDAAAPQSNSNNNGNAAATIAAAATVDDDESVLIELAKLIDDDDDAAGDLNWSANNATLAPAGDKSNFWSKMLTNRFVADNNTNNASAAMASNHNHPTTTGAPPLPAASKDTNGVEGNAAAAAGTTAAKTKKLNAWMEIFAELDPLSNPEAFDMKLNGGRSNYEQT